MIIARVILQLMQDFSCCSKERVKRRVTVALITAFFLHAPCSTLFGIAGCALIPQGKWTFKVDYSLEIVTEGRDSEKSS